MDDTPLASRLLGKTVGKWEVIEKRKKNEEDNSGFFSTCYTVIDQEGNKAFLKAYNYYYAFQKKSSSADALKFMTENFTYERDLLNFCAENKMRRIVSAIDSGEYIESGEVIPVPYLVFEIAKGNLKSKNLLIDPNLTWKLLAFHGALVGLRQLHNQKIVHQDIKPSNILIFGQNFSKISDLGSATQLNNKSNWEREDHTGDIRYAPIELLYNYFSPDWETRRFGADFFMMGGLLIYMLTGSNFISLLLLKIPETLYPAKFDGKFEEIKPYLLNAFYETIAEIKANLPTVIAQDLISVLSELSHPVPEERGNPSRMREVHKQFSLQRYISILARLAKLSMHNKL